MLKLSILIIAIAVSAMAAAAVYFKSKGQLFKWFFHDKLGWHIPDPDYIGYWDGCSDHSICKICGQDIMQDSQGNWF